jgi:hypothetical protein
MGNLAPGFGGFINDPTAQMGFQIGKSAVHAGQEYMEQNVGTSTESMVCQQLTAWAAQPLHFRYRAETLLQRLEFIRLTEARLGPVPVAA